MASLFGSGKVKSVTMEAVVIRADGSVEDLGVIARFERNPFKRLYFYFKDR